MGAEERLRFFVDILAKIEGADRADQKLGKLFDRLNEAKRRSAASTSIFGGKFFSTIGEGAERALPSVAAVATTLGTMGAVAGAAVVGLGVAGGKFALESASFKRNMTNSFELLLGSKEAAAKTYKEIDKFADETPFEARDVFTTFKRLVGSGLDVASAKQTMAGIFDIASLVDPSRQQNAIDSITLGLGKIQAQGKLTAESMNIITEASEGFINTGKLYENIGKIKGVSATAARALVEHGGVNADVARKAILATMSEGTGQKGGELGGAMRKFGTESLEGQISTLKSRIGNIFEDVNIQPVINLFKRFNDVLDTTTPAGKKLRDVMNGLFGETFAKIGEVFTPERIVMFVSVLGDMVSMGFELSKAFGGGAWDAFTAAMKPAMEVFGNGKQHGVDWITVMTNIGIVTGYTAAALVYGIGAMAAIIGWCAENWKILAVAVGLAVLPLVAVALPFVALGAATLWVIDAIGMLIAKIVGLMDLGVGFGSALVKGIEDGIAAAWGSLKGTWNGLVDTLPETVASKLRIGSPSRVTYEQGQDIVSGLVGGIESLGNLPALAMNDIAGGIGVSAGGSGSAGGHTINVTGPITIIVGAGAGGDGEAIGSAAAHAFKAQLADLLEELEREAA